MGFHQARRWLIDGMNLIGSRPNRWWNDPDQAVRDLIEELARFGSETGDEVTVVFDRRPRDVEPGRREDVDVAFASRRGRNAADYEIVQLVCGENALGWLRGLDLLERDPVADGLQLADEPRCVELRVVADEVVGAEVVVRDPSVEHVVGGHQDGVTRGDGGLA